jgi:hypothetical protein
MQAEKNIKSIHWRGHLTFNCARSCVIDYVTE